jgi:ABC-2 type transport system permease protein
MGRLWLIARREIVAYTGVASFWVALLLGPLLMGLTGLASTALVPAKAPQQTVSLAIVDADLRAAALQALTPIRDEAGRPLIVRVSAERSDTQLHVDGDALTANIDISGKPLPPAATPALTAELRAALQLRVLRDGGVSADLRDRSAAVRATFVPPKAAAGPGLDLARLGRFGVTMLLWVTLVGALGMLLQAIVRERSNRALESLMSSVRPTEIILGKLLGVGLVSLLVLGAWLAAGAVTAAGPFGAMNAKVAVVMSAAFGDPLQLAWAAMIYVMAFTLYGSVLIGLGALARDVASAQNLSRPVFGALLLVFFVALSQLTRTGPVTGWFMWIPPVTPFALLLTRPQDLAWPQIVGGIALMAASSAISVRMAAQVLVGQMNGANRRVSRVDKRGPGAAERRGSRAA